MKRLLLFSLLLAFTTGAHAADTPVSSETAATTPLSGPELTYCVQGGADRKCAAQDIANTATLSAGCATNVNNSGHPPLTISTQLPTAATITASQQDSAAWCGQQVIGNAASGQTLTLQNLTSSGSYFRFINKGAGAWTIAAGTGAINSGCTSIAQNQSADIQFDGTNWNVACGVGAPLASPAFTGVPTAPTASVGDNTTQLATDAFVTTAVANAVAGVNPAVSVNAATTAAADTSGCTYANGVAGVGATLTCAINTVTVIDGFTFNALTQSLLVKNDTQSPSGAFNGIYNLTALHTVGTGDVFTRRLDYDTATDINNTGAIPVISGTANGTTSWLLTTRVTTVGIDPLTYTQFSINPTTVVTGPASATAGHVATFNGTSGKIIQDGGSTNIVINGQGCSLGSLCAVNGPIVADYKTNRWFPSAIGAGTNPVTGTALVASTIYCSPYVVAAQGLTFKTFGAHETTTDAANSASMALYNNNVTTGRPGTKVDDTGVITLPGGSGADITGATRVNASDTVTAGLYWSCFTTNSTTVLVNSRATNSQDYAMIGEDTLATLLAAGGGFTNGVTCLGGSTCQGTPTWSAQVFTWPADLSTSTWVVSAVAGKMPTIALQGN